MALVIYYSLVILMVIMSTASFVSFSLAHETEMEMEMTMAFQPSPPADEMWIAPNSDHSWDLEPTESDDLVLAPRRTYRKDPLDHFQIYTGGWNITSRHYWASVAYTGLPIFVIGAIWFATFGICLFLICLCYCFRQREPYAGYSPIAYALSLIFLILFSIAAIIGCVVLYSGQGKFHSNSINSLQYVVNEAESTSQSLRNVSEHLVAAKQTSVVQVSLPPNVQTDIDRIQTMIDTSATTLTTTTQHNSRHINKLLHSLRLALIIITIAMLLLTFLGFAFSMLGMTFPVYILVIAGWILVTGTFILCAIFLLLHNATGDSCAAMKQWIQNPTPHTALDHILPCVDHPTAQQSLTNTKQVTSQLVDLINTVITNVSNINFAPNFVQLYYNQSGPLLPTLCNPFHPDLSDRPCAPGEVHLDNATQVWSGSMCRASPSGICFTTGRLSPNLYSQFSATVNVCTGLYQYSPFLIQLEDCSYARQTFLDVQTKYCPGLEKYSQTVYVGLLMLATAVMMSLLFWVMYGRERRHRHHRHGKENMPRGFVYAKDQDCEDDKQK
ncbi:transmembrane protein [Perilla frutescens var. frutescens]|nr:transmembrane protein [Perilla frutescens var. frutescens]